MYTYMSDGGWPDGSNFNGSVYRKQRIYTYGSREFCAYAKQMS